jgi:hypothetical protein
MRNFDSLFADPRHYRADCRLVRSAVRRGWLNDLPQADRDALVARFDAAAAARQADDPEAANVRATIAEALVAVELVRSNAAAILRPLRYAWTDGVTSRTTGRPRERWHVTDHPNRIDANDVRRRASAEGVDVRTLPAIYVVPVGAPDAIGHRIALVETPDRRLRLLCPRCNTRRLHLYPIKAGVMCRSCAGIGYTDHDQ